MTPDTVNETGGERRTRRICGIMFPDRDASHSIMPHLEALSARYSHLIRQAPDGVWWIGSPVVGQAPFPGQEERMRRFVSELPARIRRHRGASAFGVWEVTDF